MRQLKHSRLDAYAGNLPDRARRCQASPPQPGFRGGSRLRGARRLVQPLNGSIFVRCRGYEAHGSTDAESAICATPSRQGPTLEHSMRQARDAQIVTKAPYGSLRSGQSQACRCATRSAFSRHSCADHCPASAHMPRNGQCPHAGCRTHKPLPGKGQRRMPKRTRRACRPSGMHNVCHAMPRGRLVFAIHATFSPALTFLYVHDTRRFRFLPLRR